MQKGKKEYDDEFEISEDGDSSAEIYRKPKKQMKYEKGPAQGKWTQL